MHKEESGDSKESSVRAYRRQAVSGYVKIMLYKELGVCPAIVEGDLVDQSNGGCQVQHHFGHLTCGMRLTLVLDGFEREAIVVWNKAAEDHYVTGFSFYHRPLS